jgi:hypothetical protein
MYFWTELVLRVKNKRLTDGKNKKMFSSSKIENGG